MDKDEKLEYGKTYYIDRSGLSIEESEVKTLNSSCIPKVKTCLRVQLPKGFKISECTPGISFDLSGLSCQKSPIVKKVHIPSCDKNHSKECEIVGGYEIRVVGEVNFTASIPVSPICGYSFPMESHASNSKTVYVNKLISTTCCPNPFDNKEKYVDWAFLSLYICQAEDECGTYLDITISIALEYIGACECDDE